MILAMMPSTFILLSINYIETSAKEKLIIKFKLRPIKNLTDHWCITIEDNALC